MSENGIKLGDMIEDVTSKLSGIAIGVTDYLSGQRNWIIQPYTTDDNVLLRTQEVPEAYCRRVGDGVHVEPQQPMGFHAQDKKAH